MKQTLFITGTNTGAGKTVLTALLVEFLHERGPACGTAALKPVCSGARADARALRIAMNGTLTLDEINPWHFRASITPLLAARLERKSVILSQVLAHIRAMQKRFDVLFVEGAGGLLSPLGEDFDSRDLILALRAIPIVVAPNRLGVVNQVLLTLEALPKGLRPNARIVLISQPKPDTAAETNATLLTDLTSAKIFSLPWMGTNFRVAEVLKNSHVRRTFKGLVN